MIPRVQRFQPFILLGIVALDAIITLIQARIEDVLIITRE